MAQWLTNPTRNHAVVSLIPGLAQWGKGSGVALSCGVSCKHGSDPALLWLCCRLALGNSPRNGKKTKKKKKKN